MYANASLSVEGELAVHGSSFHFGSSRGLAFSVQNESPVEVLGLNPTNSFAGGLVIGEGDMQISRPGVTPSLETLVQIGAGGNTSSRSLLRVSGQLGARSGYPDEIQSLDLRSGFSFHTLDEEDPSLLSTGLFSNLDGLKVFPPPIFFCVFDQPFFLRFVFPSPFASTAFEACGFRLCAFFQFILVSSDFQAQLFAHSPPSPVSSSCPLASLPSIPTQLWSCHFSWMALHCFR